MISSAAVNEPSDVLYRLKRGLAGYISYLAACEMNQAFSEYVLYEPILRILTARGYTVQCEYECPGTVRDGPGDKKRLDFYATGHSITLGIEVKWAKSKTPQIKKDVEKLRALHTTESSVFPLLLIFGKKNDLDKLKLADPELFERGKSRIADLGKTRYGCRVFQLKPEKRLKR
jgi:hypothetical protein